MPEETRKQTLLTLEQVAQQAKETTLRTGRYIATLIIEGSLESFIAQLQDFADTHEGRKAQMFLYGLLFAQNAEIGILQQVFFISEAWLSTAKSKDELFVPPSRDPQRKEVLIVAQQVIQPPKQDGVVFEMKRNKKQKLVSVEPFQPDVQEDNFDYQSPLIDAFIIGYFSNLASPNASVH